MQVNLTGYHFEVNVIVGGEPRSITGRGLCGELKLDCISPEYRCGSGISIPADQMPAVPDEITGRWRNNDIDFHPCPRPFALGQTDAPRPNGIVSLGESPHKKEFDNDSMGFRTPSPAINVRAIFGLGENGSLGWFVEAARTDTKAGPMASYRKFTTLAAAQAEARRLGPVCSGAAAAAI